MNRKLISISLCVFTHLIGCGSPLLNQAKDNSASNPTVESPSSRPEPSLESEQWPDLYSNPQTDSDSDDLDLDTSSSTQKTNGNGSNYSKNNNQSNNNSQQLPARQNPIVQHGGNGVGYPTATEKQQYRQGIALTCNNKQWHSGLYSNTRPGDPFLYNGNDPFSRANVVKVTKSSHALARIDISVQPLRDNGTAFTNLENFLTYTTTVGHGPAAEGMLRVFHKIADQFPLLKCGGYRIAADNLTNPFVFRVVGGEPLSRTLLAQGRHEACGGVGRDTIGKSYNALNPQLGAGFANVFAGNGTNRHETPHALSFNDHSPQVDLHRLVIPKNRYVSSYAFSKTASQVEIVDLLKNLQWTIGDMGLNGNAFRIVTNAGYMANQTVSHLHIHIGECQNGARCNGQAQLAPLVVTCARHRLLPSDNLHDMVPFVDTKTVATFDIDDVLLLDPLYTAYGGQVRLAGAETKAAFEAMSDRTGHLLGLTARNYRGDVHDTTVQNVRDKLGDDAGGNALKFKGFAGVADTQYNHSATRGFFNGVLFANNLQAGKGVMLVAFINPANAFANNQVQTVLRPHGAPALKRVVFVDDRRANCESVHTALGTAGHAIGPITESISFHYTDADNP